MRRNVYRTSSSAPYFQVYSVTLKSAPGRGVTRWRKNAEQVHQLYMNSFHGAKPLEVSTASDCKEGINLSAYNLVAANGLRAECMFQSAKTFEHGGPYTDLLHVRPYAAQHDPRLRNSGRLTAFTLFGVRYPLEPKTAFYDWVYIQSLEDNPDLGAFVTHYDAFTDVSFNPDRQINCQAEACAIYAGLTKAGIDPRMSFDEFVKTVWS